MLCRLDEREGRMVVAVERAVVVAFPCRARPSIVSAGASPPGSLGSWHRVGASVGTE